MYDIEVPSISSNSRLCTLTFSVSPTPAGHSALVAPECSVRLPRVSIGLQNTLSCKITLHNEGTQLHILVSVYIHTYMYKRLTEVTDSN